MSLCRDGQDCCGLLQACIVGFLLGLPCKNNAGVSAFIRSTPAWMLGCEFVGLAVSIFLSSATSGVLIAVRISPAAF